MRSHMFPANPAGNWESRNSCRGVWHTPVLDTGFRRYDS